jgi:hypothetical protein
MRRLFTATLFLVCIATAFGQTTKPTQQPASGPKGTVITPAPIKLGDSTIPGDSEVIVYLGELNGLSTQYVAEEKALQEKYTPTWQADQAKMQQAIQKVKNANKWGDDVVFSAQTKQWIKLDPSEIEAMKKVSPPVETKK